MINTVKAFQNCATKYIFVQKKTTQLIVLLVYIRQRKPSSVPGLNFSN